MSYSLPLVQAYKAPQDEGQEEGAAPVAFESEGKRIEKVTPMSIVPNQTQSEQENARFLSCLVQSQKDKISLSLPSVLQTERNIKEQFKISPQTKCFIWLAIIVILSLATLFLYLFWGILVSICGLMILIGIYLCQWFLTKRERPPNLLRDRLNDLWSAKYDMDAIYFDVRDCLVKKINFSVDYGMCFVYALLL